MAWRDLLTLEGVAFHSHARAHCLPATAERPCCQDGDTGREVSQSDGSSWGWVSVLTQAAFCASTVVERWLVMPPGTRGSNAVLTPTG